MTDHISCDTAEELMALAGKEGIDIPDDLLEEVSGGGLYGVVNGTGKLCGK